MSRRPTALLIATMLLTSITAPALGQSATDAPPVAVPSPIIPVPTPVGAPELEARFPAEIGGAPLDIESYGGSDLEAQFEGDDIGTAELLAILAPVGKRIADMSVASGSVETDAAFALILALRVAGADMSALLDGFASLVLDWDEIERTDLQLGGKAVIKVVPSNSGPSVEPIHAYVDGDVLWFVQSQEPLLTEVFTALP